MPEDQGRARATTPGASPPCAPRPGPARSLRLDANGAWDVEQAVRAIEALAPAGLELVEEPVHGLAGMRAVRERVPVRVAIDETAAERGALGGGVADAVCLKISRCGGIGALVAAAALVRASGAEVYLASTLDGPLGVAAALQAAAALASRGPAAPLRPGDARAVRGHREPAAGPRRRDRAALGPRARRRAGLTVGRALLGRCGDAGGVLERQPVAAASTVSEPFRRSASARARRAS